MATLDEILGIVKNIETDVKQLKADVKKIEGDVSAIKTQQVHDSKVLEFIWADAKQSRASLLTQGRTLEMLRNDFRLVRSNVNDLVGDHVTTGDLKTVHTDLERLEHDRDEHDSRLNKLEAFREIPTLE